MSPVRPESQVSSPSDRVYDILVQLFYPRSFRTAYGDQVRLLFRDLRREATMKRGALGLPGFWMRTLRDLLVSSVRLRVRALVERSEARRLPGDRRPPSRPSSDVPWRPLMQDVRYAARILRKSPGFTVVAILTLALGIGATTAIFSVVNGVLLRPLPYRSAEQLVHIWDRLDWIGLPKVWLSGPEIDDLRRQASLFEGFAALRGRTAQLTGDREPLQVEVGRASANVFELLGVRAALGTAFRLGDDAPGAANVAVLSHEFWMGKFGSDSGVVGRTVVFDDRPTMITGVLPEDFSLPIHAGQTSSTSEAPRSPEVWLPYQVDMATAPRGQHGFAVLARLKAGVTLEQARAELHSLGSRQDEQWYGNSGFTFTAVRLKDDLVGHLGPSLLLLLVAVGFLLVIATANIATLMLARAQARTQEVAIRSALGATRARIMRLALVEAGLIAAFGGVLGFGLAAGGLDVLTALAPEALIRRGEIGIDAPVFVFSGIVTVAAAVLCGIMPASHSSSVGRFRTMQEGGRRTVDLRRMLRTRRVLVVAELALSLCLMTGAGLLTRSLGQIVNVYPGFEPANVLSFDIALSKTRYEDEGSRIVFFRDLMERVAALPGVERAAATGNLPVSAEHNNQTDGRLDVMSEDESVMFDYMPVTPSYFTTMGIEIVEGRGFTERDRSDTPLVAVVDERLAAYWPDGEAVGGTIIMPGQEWTVVGVVRHARLYGVTADDRPQFYAPYAQMPFDLMSVVIRADTEPPALVPAVRAAVAGLDRNQPIHALRTMEALMKRSTSERRFGATLMAAFALSGLLLATLGVFGMLSYSVVTRRREIGVRMALGAQSGRVLRFVLCQGLTITGIGLMFGLGISIAMAKAMSGLLYGIGSSDPLTFVAAPLLLTAIATLACLLPAWRATRIDPLAVIHDA